MVSPWLLQLLLPSLPWLLRGRREKLTHRFFLMVLFFHTLLL